MLKQLLIGACLTAVALGSPARAALDYDIHVFGLPAGELSIELDERPDGLHVRGRAAATGPWQLLTGWRGEFETHATGGPGRYHVQEYWHGAERRTSADAEHVRVERKRKAARERSRERGEQDIVSALLLARDCPARRDVFTGMSRYRLERTDERDAPLPNQRLTNARRCSYDVLRLTDGDSEPRNQKVVMWFAHDDGAALPVRLDLRGGVSGSIRLRPE